MTQCSVLNLPFLSSSDFPYLINNKTCNNHSFFNPTRFLAIRSSVQSSRLSTAIKAATAMEGEQRETVNGDVSSAIRLLFVEMGVGYDQHGQDITVAAMRACKDAISSNSIPAFRRGSIPGVTFGQMKLQIKLGVPQPLQQLLNIERVKSVFPYGEIVNVDVVDGGLICSSGVCVEEMGDKNDDCYIVNAAVYVEFKRETNKKGDEIFNAYLQPQQRQVSDVARTMFAQAGAVKSYVGT